jgi:hypothetical protein
LTSGQWTAPEWEDRLRRAGLNAATDLLDRAPDQLSLAGTCELLSKPGLAERQRWRWTLPEGDAVLYIKRYGRAPSRMQWDRIVRQSSRHSRGWWEHTQGKRLAGAYVPAAGAVACAERMNGLIEQRSVVVLAAVAGDGLDRVWTRLSAEGAPLTRGLARHDLAVRLGRFVSAFHQTGLCHRDLYLCHVFAELDPAGTRPPTFTLIDLARTFQPRLRRTRWLLKDLAQLDCSARQVGVYRTDRLRCLRAYLGLQTRAARLRWYARRVLRRSDAILRRIARKSALA